VVGVSAISCFNKEEKKGTTKADEGSNLKNKTHKIPWCCLSCELRVQNCDPTANKHKSTKKGGSEAG
jgi:hypothetical protein